MHVVEILIKAEKIKSSKHDWVSSYMRWQVSAKGYKLTRRSRTSASADHSVLDEEMRSLAKSNIAVSAASTLWKIAVVAWEQLPHAPAGSLGDVNLGTSPKMILPQQPHAMSEYLRYHVA